MKLMIDGVWREDAASAAVGQRHAIATGRFRNRVTADGWGVATRRGIVPAVPPIDFRTARTPLSAAT